MSTLSEIIKTSGTTIVDVRTEGEFAGGHVAGSINIPLDKVALRMEEFGKMTNIVVCCAAGGRSAQAAMMLMAQGIPYTDGGAWTNLNFHKNN